MSKHDKQPNLTRECPVCKKIITYCFNFVRRNADKRNSRCKSCSNSKENNPMFGRTGKKHPRYGLPVDGGRLGKLHIDETKRKISTSRKKKNYRTSLGKKHTPETIEKLKKIASNRSEEWKEKQRISRVNFIIKNGGNRSFNKKACAVFEELNTRLFLQGKHSLKGGEVTIKGYFLDYCDETNKICIEWDEPAHHNPNRVLRDKKKHEILSSHLGEDWIIVRWDERNKDWREGYNSPRTDKHLLDNIRGIFLESFYKI